MSELGILIDTYLGGLEDLQICTSLIKNIDIPIIVAANGVDSKRVLDSCFSHIDGIVCTTQDWQHLEGAVKNIYCGLTLCSAMDIQYVLSINSDCYVKSLKTVLQCFDKIKKEGILWGSGPWGRKDSLANDIFIAQTSLAIDVFKYLMKYPVELMYQKGLCVEIVIYQYLERNRKHFWQILPDGLKTAGEVIHTHDIEQKRDFLKGITF